jgi:hypothetical protein
MDTFKNVTDKITDKTHGMNRQEGEVTKGIESVTAAAPSVTWLVLAGGAMVGSLALKIAGRDKTANFVGQWVPTILMLGLYNKIVKVMGSERGDARSF